MKKKTRKPKNGPPARVGVAPLPSGSSFPVTPPSFVGQGDHRRGFYTALGYQSQRSAVRDGRTSSSGSGALHMRFAREQLANQAREFERDNALFGRMIEGADSYTVAQGFALQARTEDPEWNAAMEAFWKDFWVSPEVSGELSGPELESLVFREVLTTGDVGVLMTDQGRLQIFESEQIKGTDPLADGVDVDPKTQRVTGYWGAPWNQGMVDHASAVRYSVDDFMYIGKRTRPSDRRAVPPCQRSFAMLHRINDVCDSEALAFQLQSRLAIQINKQGGPLVATKSSKRDDKRSNAEGQAAERITELEPGLIVWGYQGEEVKGIDRTLPGANFPSSIVMFIRLLGLTLGMPVEVILLDWTKSNYSQSRAVLEQAFTAFRKWQKLLEDRFHRRVYRMAVDMAVARRVVTRRPDMYAHDWIKPTFPWIDQLAEAQAWGAKLDRNLCTLSQALKSLGKELDDELPARKAEIVKAIKTRDEIFAETGELIDWHPLAGYASSVNPLAEQQDDADDSKAQKDGEKPAAKQLTVFELAALQAASANPSVGNRGPVTIVIKQPRGPIKTVTRVLERNKKGGGDVVEQSHTYGQDEESRGSVTTVEPLPAREPAREVKAVAKGEVA